VYWEEHREWIENRIRSLHRLFNRVLESIKFISIDTAPVLLCGNTICFHIISEESEKSISNTEEWECHTSLHSCYNSLEVSDECKPSTPTGREGKQMILSHPIPSQVMETETVIHNCFFNMFLEQAVLSFPMWWSGSFHNCLWKNVCVQVRIILSTLYNISCSYEHNKITTQHTEK
jgi:hypothetical protein